MFLPQRNPATPSRDSQPVKQEAECAAGIAVDGWEAVIPACPAQPLPVRQQQALPPARQPPTAVAVVAKTQASERARSFAPASCH